MNVLGNPLHVPPLAAAAAAAPRPPVQARVGRFELLKPLGRGAQAAVWLAFDPQLEREVALKLFQGGASTDEVDDWLREARLMATLSHPGILTVHEAARDGQRPYLVLERVDGGTLADKVKRAALAPREAAQIVRDMADAVAFAHARGIIHRDLKPSNVLLASDGRLRVMDFGIAARVAGQHDGRVVGTPGYISPEAARGDAPTAAMDVFSAGMVLGHLLAGGSLRVESDPLQAVQRAIHEDVPWPDTEAARAVPAPLRALVMRAVARDPAQRFDSAVALRDALAEWLAPPAASPEALAATLAQLVQRMQAGGEFAALSGQVMRVQDLVGGDKGNLSEMASALQGDAGLAQQLLQMANSAQFRRNRDEEVGSVERAVSLMGFSAIRNMALSSVLLGNLGEASASEQMQGLLARALLTAQINDGLAPAGADRDEAFLAGMLSELGRILVAQHFPTEAAQIEARLPALETRTQEAEDAVVREVLGMSYDELAQGVARQWNLPAKLQAAMVRPRGPVPVAPVVGEAQRGAWRLKLAGEMAGLLVQQGGEAQPQPQVAAKVEQLAQRYSQAVEAPVGFIKQAVSTAQSHFKELASSFRSRLAGRKADPAATRSGASMLSAQTPTARRRAARERLQQGIAHVTHLLAADQFGLNEVLREALGALAQGGDFQRVLFALRDAASGTLVGRMGVGVDVPAWCARLRVPVQVAPAADLVAAACIARRDTVVADARAPQLAAQLPAWLRGHEPGGFVLLPLSLKGAPLALIYADRAGPARLQIDERELALMAALRDQVTLAFKASR